MRLLRGTDGQTYQTQNVLASGGEGHIVALQGRGDVVAKLYHCGQATAAREAKRRAMLADPPRDEMRERCGHAAIAWPLALLSEEGRFAGFVMSRIDAPRSLVNAYNPRAMGALRFDWHDQHQIAANLCAAINALHVKGYVVGDVNPRNVLVTPQGLVTLVDTDSFQVRANGVVHRCPVGTPEYTPRELQGQHFDRIDRGPAHDRFGLAILVFQLLMGGFHPFVGALKNPQDSLPGKIDEWCIQNGVFPWRDNPRLSRPPAARPLEDLHPALRDLFLCCFVSGHTAPNLRPNALEWYDTLLEAKQHLVRCAAGTHWRHPGAGPCHACQRQQAPQRWATAPHPQPRPASPLPRQQPPPPPSPPTSVPQPTSVLSLKRRCFWEALVLSVFFPGLGQIYNGQLMKGVILGAIIGFCPAPPFMLPNLPFWLFITVGTSPFINVAMPILVIVYAHIDSCISAMRLSSNYKLKTYNKWYIYLFYAMILIFSTKIIFASSRIASDDNMKNTLLAGDFVLFEKLGKIERGNIVSFNVGMGNEIYPEGQIVARCIAVGGQRLTTVDGIVYVDGSPARLDISMKSITSNDNISFVVPDNYIFVFGDNSSVLNKDHVKFRIVTHDDIIGRAVGIMFSWDAHAEVRWQRLGKALVHY